MLRPKIKGNDQIDGKSGICFKPMPPSLFQRKTVALWL